MSTDAPLPGPNTPNQPVVDPHLPTDLGLCHAMILELKQVATDHRQQIRELQQGMQELLNRLHRPPRDEWPPHQPPLFPEVHPDAVATPPEAATANVETPMTVDAASATTEDIDRPKKKRKGHGRRSLEELAKKLPRVRREHKLTEAELLCPCCGKPRRKIGEQITCQLEYVPAKLVCLEHVQFTYSCSHCPEHIATAPKPPQPIDRGFAGPQLLALVTTNKFDDYLPLYRLELILSRYGLYIARSTLCGWLWSLGELVRPLVDLMTREIFKSLVVQTDGTSIQVLLEELRQTRTGYFWPHLGDEQHPYVVVDFSLDKTKEHPQKFLADYSGYLQVDAYAGYDLCFVDDPKKNPNRKIEVGCWSHAERYFEAARDSDPIHMAEALAYIRSLFAIEARAKREHLAESEVLALRQHEAVPILDDFKKWLDRTRDQVLPKSPIADAIRYVTNQWEPLRRYTEAGFLSMDNNAVERINKLIARGRINWLFVGSPQGGETASQLLSLVLTCRRLHMDSFAYLSDVFTRLPGMPADRLPELLPDRWLAAHPEAKHPPEREGRGHGDPNPRRKRRR